MAAYLMICSVALVASALTFFSGFGLGTLLLPAFALFFPVETAVALTAVVHFFNGLFKLLLVWRHIDRAILVRFGLAAVVGALTGAWALSSLSDAQAVLEYSLLGRTISVLPAKLVVGILLLAFAGAELAPQLRDLSFPAQYASLGGLLSGFFGGLAGMQGALRSAFLIRTGLAKEWFVGTSAGIAFLVDVSRLGVYVPLLRAQSSELDYGLVAAAVLAALVGAALGNRYLPKVTLRAIRATVAGFLFVVALGLISGIL